MYSSWCALSLETRFKIAKEFGIEKKGPTEVFSNQIKNDGFLLKDIETALSLNNLQKYLGTQETDLPILWGWLIDKIEGRSIPEPIIQEEAKPIKTKVISNETKVNAKKTKTSTQK